MTTNAQQDVPEQQQPVPEAEQQKQPVEDKTKEKEDGFEPNFFFDVREAESLKDLYNRMAIIGKNGESADWRTMDPREYLLDNNENEVDETDDAVPTEEVPETPEEVSPKKEAVAKSSDSDEIFLKIIGKSDDLKMLSAKAVIEDSSKKFLS